MHERVYHRPRYDRPPHAASFQGRLLVSPESPGIFGPLGYESPRVLRRRLELGRGGSRAVRASVQRINAGFIERFVGTLLKVTVQWGPTRDINPRMFLLTRCGCYR